MTRWIGASTLGSAKINIQVMVREKDVAGLRRYVDILRDGYRNETDRAERTMLVVAGKMAQSALVRLGSAPHEKAGWRARAADIRAECGA